MQFTDTVVLDGVRLTRDGYLVASAKTARTGIQVYAGREVDPDNAHGLRDRAQVRVYRAPEEVFHKDAMASMAHRPVTVDHPSEMVTAANWKRHSGGMTGDEVARDGDFVRVPLTLMDKQAIDAWEAGKRELSWGYSCQLEFKDGVTPDGQAFDAQQRTIRANHLAICSAARAGPDCRIGDGDEERTTGDQPMADNRTVTVDSVPYIMNDQVAALVERMQGLLGDSAKALETANAAHTAAIAAKDAELGKKDAEIGDLKGKVLDGAALDALVAERAAVVERAKKIAPTLDAAGKSNADIRRAAVAAKLGDAAVKDKSDDYVGALFDHAATSGNVDPIRQVVSDGTANVNDAQRAWQDAQAKRREYLETAHRSTAAA